MNDAAAMCRIECVSDLRGELQDLLYLQRLVLDAMFERLAFEELHRHERLPVLAANVVNGADVRMVQCAGGLGLAFEALKGLRVLCQFVGKEFKSDGASKPGVRCFVNYTHATAAKFFGDSVMGYGCADHEEGLGRKC